MILLLPLPLTPSPFVCSVCFLHTGTLREEDTDSDSLQLLSKAFDDLQDDLRAKSQVRISGYGLPIGNVIMSFQTHWMGVSVGMTTCVSGRGLWTVVLLVVTWYVCVRTCMHVVQSDDDELMGMDGVTMRKLRPLPPSADSSPLNVRRSKAETLAIFDGILAQIEGDSNSLTTRSVGSQLSDQASGAAEVSRLCRSRLFTLCLSLSLSLTLCLSLPHNCVETYIGVG